MRKPTNFQRLSREKTLYRYLLAVESVDLAAIEQIWQQATHDELLEYMLLEAHEIYLEQKTSVLQEEIPMDFNEGVHKSLPQEEADELQAVQGTLAPQPSGYTRWLQVLAAIVLIALLSGGVLLYARVRPIASTAHNTQASYKWCVISGPASEHPTLIPALASVAALAPDNVWAVGNESSRGTLYTYPSVPLIEHWDGTKWSIVPGADITALYQSLAQRLSGVPSARINEYADLSSIFAVSADDIWAIGNISADGPSTYASQELVEHWDGRRWQLIAGPDVNPATGHASLISITATAANDIWVAEQIIHSASGSGSQPSNVQPQMLVERWNGSSWQNVPLLASSRFEEIQTITATTSDNVWVVGVGQQVKNQGVIPLAIHWNGRDWQASAFPQTFSDLNLGKATTTTAGDLWLTGTTQQSDGTRQPVVVHWDGKQWNTLPGLKNVKALQSATLQQETDSVLSAIAANNAHDVWVTGQTAAGDILVEHWDGQSWNVASQAMPSPGEINGLALNGNKIWMVGDRYDKHAQTSKGALIAMSC